MVYSPPQTPPPPAARAGGAKAANGLAMLLHQGAAGFGIWFGPPAALDAMRQGLVNSLRD